MSIEDKNFELTLAETCKTLYERYEQHYKEKTAVLLHNPWSKFNSDHCIKALRLFYGWLRLKLASIRDSESSNCPIKIVCLNGELKVPKNLDCVYINPLIISSYFELMRSISNIEKFSNLKSLSLISATLNNDVIVLIVPRLSFLEFISLNTCEMANGHSKIFENCIALQEIQLIFCKFSDAAPIKLPSQLKGLKIDDDDLYRLDTSECIQLESL
jgi:hypothetical protein